MNLKRQKTSIKNRKYTGGKKDVTYFSKKLNEFGLKVPKYLDNNTISQKQFKSLQNKLERNITSRQNEERVYNERLDPKMEEYYEHLRQKAQIERAIAKQNMERHDNYLK